MIFQRFMALLSATLCFSLTAAFATSTVDVRLNHNSLDKNGNALYVDIDVRVDNQDRFVLAGQNYRIFYPTDVLSLDQSGSKSQLSSEQYTGLQFSSVLENVEASGEGAISFDKDMGFANLSVELLDNYSGGASLSEKDGWVTIATLKFNVIDQIEEVSMILGREGKSETYATAFVEIAEWEAPLKTNSVVIDEYIDFNLSLNSLSVEGITYEINVGPNPSSDFVEIKSDKVFGSDIELTVIDLTGKLIKSVQLAKGSRAYSVDVSELKSASYIFDLKDTSGNSLMSQKMVVAR